MHGQFVCLLVNKIPVLLGLVNPHRKLVVLLRSLRFKHLHDHLEQLGCLQPEPSVVQPHVLVPSDTDGIVSAHGCRLEGDAQHVDAVRVEAKDLS